MARQPKTAKPKAKFDPKCITCGTKYNRTVQGGRLVVAPACAC